MRDGRLLIESAPFWCALAAVCCLAWSPAAGAASDAPLFETLQAAAASGDDPPALAAAEEDAGWWDGFAPAPDGQGLRSGALRGRCASLLVHDGKLYAHGVFDNAGGQTVQNIAAFDGRSWTALPGVGPPRYDLLGPTLAVFDGKLVVAEFSGGVTAVRRLDGTNWTALGTAPIGAVQHLHSFTVAGQERLYLVVNDALDVTSQGRVYRWNPQTLLWQVQGTGLPVGVIFAMAEHDGDLYVTVYGQAAGMVWRLRGDEPGGDWASVYASAEMRPIHLLSHQGSLYTSGLANNAGLLLRYNPSGVPQWQNVGATVTGAGHVYHMASWQERIVLVGNFPGLGAATSRNVAYWQDGTVHAMGSGLTSATENDPFTVAVFGGDVYVAGRFGDAGGRASSGIARWRDLDDPLATPTINPTVPATLFAGEPVNIAATIASYQTVRGVRLGYRTFDQDAYSFRPMALQTGSNDVYRATIPGGAVTTHGLQHFVEVETDLGTFTMPPDAAQAAAYVGTEVGGRIIMPLAGRYELIGIPFVPTGTMSQIFEGVMGEYKPSRWRLERWDPETETYLPFPQVPPADPGTGYFLIQRDEQDVLVTGVSSSTVGGATIPLEPGWNMISTPYQLFIPWAQVVRPAGVENQLITRANDEYVVVSPAVMAPGTGYFVYHAGANPVTLRVPTVSAGKAAGDRQPGSAAEAELADLAGCAWTIRIAASQGGRHDLIKTIGALAPGAEGPGNLHQPPALPHDLAVWLEHESAAGVHRLRRDLRSFDQGGVWDLVVRPAAGGGPVTLTFAGLDEVPADLQIALAAPHGTVDLRRAGATWQSAADGETHLRLVVGSQDLVEQAAGSLPQPFALLPAYPNPSNPSTRVTFALPRATAVRLSVYDLAGRRVRTLLDDVRAPGRHAIEWDGADDTGRGLASGIYVLRLQAGELSQTRKLTLVR